MINEEGARIPSAYPKFDTLIFKSFEPYQDKKIICNFKPDSVYSIIESCCGVLDIIPTSRLPKTGASLIEDEYADSLISESLKDKPFISIRTKASGSDSIYAYHFDASCATEFHLIDTTLWQMGVPPKCYYWNNITTIIFFVPGKHDSTNQSEEIEAFTGIKNAIQLEQMYFRLFDNQRFIITYDALHQNATLAYE